jgi:hypothetical protein
MMKGKRMILEQGGEWDKTGRSVTSKLGSVAETLFDARQADAADNRRMPLSYSRCWRASRK